MDNSEKAQVFLAAVIGAVILSIIMAWPTQLLWNSCLVPAVDGINQIGFWQALGLNVLVSILFKSNAKSNKK
jgi:hypothetical protein